MLIQEVITVAKHSELNSLAVKQDNLAILAFINLGLIELYKEFILQIEETSIIATVKDEKIELPLDFMYPLKAYYIKIVNSEEVKEEVYSDKPSAKNQISFTNNSKVKVPAELVGKQIFVEYSAKPPKYTLDNLDEEMALPEVLVDCLLHYIGYRGHLGVRSDGQSENTSHYVRFMQSVKKARDRGVISFKNTQEMPNRLFDRGFV